MRGVRTLRRHGVRFTAIAVVTPATVGRADEIAEFFESVGATSVGFNLEEYEGANTARPGIDAAAARAFWRVLLRRRAEGSALTASSALAAYNCAVAGGAGLPP